MSDDVDYLMLMQALAGDFLDESADKLEEIEQSLKNLEQKNGREEDNILLIKRDVHSIKGGGVPFGFPTVSKLCHGLENYFETTSDHHNFNISDIRIFVDGIASIVEERREPDEQEQEMLLKSMPSGRKQSGRMAIPKGFGLLIMPSGLQRKIVGQELAQLGFKLTLEDNPVTAIGTALVLKPNFVIVSMINTLLTGVEISRMFHGADTLKKIPFAVLTAGDVGDVHDVPDLTTLIHKGPTFTQDLLKFINTACTPV